MPGPNRREALALAAATGALGTAGAANRNSPIKAENEKPGTTDWQLTYVKFDAKAKYRQSLIEGYCTRTSVAAGEKLGFCVSTDPATPFHIDIYRTGYYGGTGGRAVREVVERVTVYARADGNPKVRRACVQVWFRRGGCREYVVVAWAKRGARPARWATESYLSGEGEYCPLDFGRPDDVRAAEWVLNHSIN